MTRTIRFATCLLVCALSPLAHGAQDLKALSDEFNSLPTAPGERLLENLIHNPMIDDVMMTSATMDKVMHDLGPVEQLVVKKQFLLHEIYRQALLELRGPHHETQLKHLFFGGIVPGGGRVILPTIERLTSERVLFEIIDQLTRRDENVAIIALDILRLKGPRYPSTDSFARGLARFAATSSADAELFNRILNTHERLYELVCRHPNPDGESYVRYHVDSIAREISQPVYNPAIAEPKLREKIVSNLLNQIARRSGEIRGDLIQGLVTIQGDSRVAPFIETVLRTSVDSVDLNATLRGVRTAANKKHIPTVVSQLNRYASLAPPPAGRRPILTVAIEIITEPFWSNSDDEAKPLRSTVLQLFRHSKSQVRKQAVSALNSEVFTPIERERIMRKLLRDPAENVRRAALNLIWSPSGLTQGLWLIRELEHLASQDTSPHVRSIAEQAKAEVLDINNRQCASLFLGH